MYTYPKDGLQENQGSGQDLGRPVDWEAGRGEGGASLGGTIGAEEQSNMVLLGRRARQPSTSEQAKAKLGNSALAFSSCKAGVLRSQFRRELLQNLPLQSILTPLSL